MAAQPKADLSASGNFNAARDGKQQEAPAISDQQQQSADKYDRAVNDKNASRLDVKAAETEFQFNAHASGPPTNKTTAEPKKQASKPMTYTSQKSGQAYETDKAKEAAQNLDQASSPASAAQTRSTVSSHHAPAPKPSWSNDNPQRGKSVQQIVNSPNAPGANAPESAKHEWAMNVLSQARKNRDVDQAKSHEATKTNTSSLER